VSDSASHSEPAGAFEVEIVPEVEPKRFALGERFQRGLLLRGSKYIFPSTTDDWRTGLVGLLRPQGPSEPERVWLVSPAVLNTPMPLPQGPQAGKETALALALDALPAEGTAARFEEGTGVPTVLFSPQGAQGGPLATPSLVDELRATLAYSDEELATQSPGDAYASLADDADVRDFFKILREHVPRVWVTQAVIALCVLIWLAQVANGIDPTAPAVSALLAWGSNQPGLSLGAQPWRLLSAGFLHGGILHLALNMYVLWHLGMLGERLFGHRSYLAVYLAAIVGGFIASAAWNPTGPSVGASGGIFGVCGAILGFVLMRRNALPRQAFLHVGRTMGFFVVANLGLTLWLSAALPIDNAGHVGGLIVGFLAGLFLSRELPVDPALERRRMFRLPVVGLALGLLFAGAWQLPSVARQRANGGQEVWASFYGLADAWVSLETSRTPQAFATLRETLAGLRATTSGVAPPLREQLLETLGSLERLVESAESAGDGRVREDLMTDFDERFRALQKALSL
jgi:membrane associated rhomboid family serine protease